MKKYREGRNERKKIKMVVAKKKWKGMKKTDQWMIHNEINEEEK